MCGIVGGVSKSNITPILVNGLKRLEYRGYDSAGVVTLCENNKLNRARAVGKVVNLEKRINDKKTPLDGAIGIAHTRWATHGEPSSRNAHPHICNHTVSVVHNGIIENFLELKATQEADGYAFTSDTDTEVIGHAIHQHLQDSGSLLEATQKAVLSFKGAYGIGVISPKDPGHVIATRSGSPLVVGLSDKGNFIASDQMALLDITKDFIYLLEGDIADITLDSVTIYDKDGNQVKREIKTSKLESGQVSKRGYDHYMLKEIFEQPQAIRDTLESRITK
ncbi:MAG: glutamine--fructose-6-phosphate aminotransferase, partial [Gammaproteobacteria bacterium]|nr:glutamine--fructose-6-phosphate aminotransferase [Gammaproteobacteria bacterium]